MLAKRNLPCTIIPMPLDRRDVPLLAGQQRGDGQCGDSRRHDGSARGGAGGDARRRRHQRHYGHEVRRGEFFRSRNALSGRGARPTLRSALRPGFGDRHRLHRRQVSGHSIAGREGDQDAGGGPTGAIQLSRGLAGRRKAILARPGRAGTGGCASACNGLYAEVEVDEESLAIDIIEEVGNRRVVHRPRTHLPQFPQESVESGPVRPNGHRRHCGRPNERHARPGQAEDRGHLEARRLVSNR